MIHLHSFCSVTCIEHIQYMPTALISKVLYVGKPQPMTLMDHILINTSLEIICLVIESPDRHYQMITSVSGVGDTIKTKPIWEKKETLPLDDNG